jgi:pyridoxal 5'-phosphate synthase pdxS subunit
MAKSRIGHIVEAQILQAIGVDYIDECVPCTIEERNDYSWRHAC